MVTYMKKHKNYLLIGFAIICIGLIYLFLPNEEIAEVTATPVDATETKAENEQIKKPAYIYIDIKGAVRSPGVYKLPLDARVQDAVKTAGGLTEEANNAHLNLAEKLKDEMSIYVYKKGEEVAEADNVNQNQQNTATEEKINLNIATTTDLQQVPGIGASKATAIIEYREKEGLFQTIEDLQKVTGIGEKTVEKLKEYLDVK
ncbi:ComEA family DNA-binding protein [Listeria sp. FSL L7-1485]|uniref:ComEA family DNA-binding protein n=1 Tax=Listeria immobilis TaxID=2713502 RepID=A0A7X0X7R2_9LIST|nr:helix-hairpin-helix domain-containing protein [Listeria immobilis]MBC1489165.1 ComEA family DNA-binding protein [Listeria immobilis]MBC1507521.1 ComEA family DNA-binding protein [Listeria immobilis]MBC1510386.1 ComEA family DNA-binding protein [Listeria immobilis]MBC1516066.1 ComEA family DNA-binding protein [Listeria immobilis]MBC1536335.1 ComEA family DNA-binding protein [Listeria immobilis]